MSPLGWFSSDDDTDENGGCNGHHYGDWEMSSFPSIERKTIDPIGGERHHRFEVTAEYVRECVHYGCLKKQTRTRVVDTIRLTPRDNQFTREDVAETIVETLEDEYGVPMEDDDK